MPCGAPRTLDPGFPGARSFADTPHPPMAQWQTPMALVVPVLSALTEGGGSNAATRLYGVSKNSSYRGQERLSGLQNPYWGVRAPTRCCHSAWKGMRGRRACTSRSPQMRHTAGPWCCWTGHAACCGRGHVGARHASAVNKPGSAWARSCSTQALGRSSRMAHGALGVSCVRSVAPCSGLARADGRRSPCATAGKCGASIKERHGLSAVANDPRSQPRPQSILTPHSLWRPPRCMRISWKPSLQHGVDVVRLSADAPIPLQKTRHDGKSEWMSTGWCLIVCACTVQHVQSLRWHEEYWSPVSRSMRYSFFKRLRKSRTHVDLHRTEPVPERLKTSSSHYSDSTTPRVER
jgi:hypothetical protein